jgi:hypothetical protein
MPIKQSITPQEVVDFLNALILQDPKAVNTMFVARVPCNENLAKHPTVQVMPGNIKGTHYCGVMGIINGIFGADEQGYGCISMKGQKIGNKFIVSGFEMLNDKKQIK